MKNLSFLHKLVLATALTCSLISCREDEEEKQVIPTSAEFNAVQNAAIANQKQTFTLNADLGYANFTSSSGVNLSINGAMLRKNGAPVTGTVNIEFIEIFDKGHMLVCNKPTMGLMADGKKALLKSGGEFYIRATQGGVELTSLQNMSLLVPATTIDPEMSLWEGIIEDGILVWDAVDTLANDTAIVRGEGNNNYYCTFGNFGWTNIDKFWSDPRPRTTIQVKAPTGYDNTNCSIYLSYDGEGTNALAQLDTYANGIFSEHYGQIPIGLNCHIIFATAEAGGKWRWAIQGVSIAANATYTFNLSETTIGTEAQLVAAVNALP